MAWDWDYKEVEADLETRFVRVVEAYGWVARKLRYDGRNGAADRICYGPGGRFALAELKNGGSGRLSKPQRDEIAEMAKLGIKVWVIKTNLDIEDFAAEVLKR